MFNAVIAFWPDAMPWFSIATEHCRSLSSFLLMMLSTVVVASTNNGGHFRRASC